ncbi:MULTISPECIES: hypothetical protein [Microbacterium]|uniref:hypothetical protein n=1 Tax=Microbacterium TaxID=33882 RepID=UPI00278A6021|nr:MULTISPECIES: hypothetical protein [Microbacterium]MDQ1085278.1 hypothetical protein [Microbacterium sp. SORGH_AS_0344]MDQ1169415.1 hypothetical protein [Microbacterium proteolyticum]
MAGKAAAAVGIGVAGVAAGLVARTLVKKERESDGDGAHPEGWKAVTILGDAAEFSRGGYPEPLQRLAGGLEIRVEPAPGDKGFEVHARVREGAQLEGDDPARALREALRDAKQVFETGEILRATPRPHGERPPTLLGGAVDKAEDEAKGEGVL